MKHILGQIRRAIDNYNMIEDGDKIGIALSGGKDSICLLHAFKTLQYFYPKNFEIVAISINPGFDFFNESFLQKICDDLNIPLYIERYDIKRVVFDDRKEKNPCSLCANMRRGMINSVAERIGCNKIALGHNLDDVLETFLMNFFYAGSLTVFSPVALMSRSKITAIRPMIYVPEKEVKRFMKRNNLEAMKKVCPNDGYSVREDMRKLIIDFSLKLPYVRSNMLGAIERANLCGWKKLEDEEYLELKKQNKFAIKKKKEQLKNKKIEEEN